MKLGFRGRRFGVRLAIILSISLFVVLIQIISVSRLNTPTKYPWEDLLANEKEDIERRSLKTALEDQTKLSSSKEFTPLIKDSNKEVDIDRVDSKPDIPVSNNTVVHTLSSPITTVSAPSSKTPKCEIIHKDAISALSRAKTEECKDMIKEIVCLSQEDKLYNTSIINLCPRGRNPAKQFKAIPYTEGVGPLPRVVFLLSVHGRAVRQIKRLFKAIYHSHHYYYIHVDFNSDYLFSELKSMMTEYPNVYFPTWRMATIWGGASLLQMLLRALEELEYVLTEWKWDFFINLSESDYPLKTNDELIQFLRVHRQVNFVKTHGGDINKFIQKQGLDRTFVECENHMWRVGNRVLPTDITVDGGSDWIAINRNYSHYLVTDQSPFLNGLKKYYEYSLLPAESFFHTVLRNGPLCDTFVRTNLRVTNWNRKLGCRCQYKHIVDWCGCSPNDFISKDINRLQTPTDHQFFARKFEATVNHQVINELDAHLYGSYPEDTLGLKSYWENVFHNDDPKLPSSAHFTVYNSFLRLSFRHILTTEHGNQSKYGGNCPIPMSPVLKEINILYDNDEFVGHLVKFQDGINEGVSNIIQFESLYIPISHSERHSSATCPDSKVTSIEVGTNWDGKESVFRNYGGIIGIDDELILAIRMNVGRLCHVNIIWQNPLGSIEQKVDLKLEASSVVTYQKLKSDQPLMPGIWNVRIELQTGELFMSETFMVIPLVYDKKTPLDNPVMMNGKRATVLKPSMDAKKYLEWRNNVGKEGTELEDWVDQLVTQFWNLKSVCVMGDDIHCKSIQSCDKLSWSSFSPDPKSELSPVNSNGRLR